jgi:hypothetical protein
MRILKSITVIFITFAFVYGVMNSIDAGPEGGENSSLQLTYQFKQPIISQVEVFKHPFKKVTIPATRQLNREGEPVLPIKFAAILLPHSKEAREVTVMPGEKVALEGNFNVEPGQRPVPLGREHEAEFVPPRPEIYDSTAPFPLGHIFKAQTVVKRGYRILIVSLSPVSYIPKTGKIAYSRELTVIVETVPEKKPPRTYRGLPGDAELVRKSVDNPEMLATYPMRQK